MESYKRKRGLYYIMNYDVVECGICKHRPTNLDKTIDSSKNASTLMFPDKICPLQCGNICYNKWFSSNFFCAFGEVDKTLVCKNCKYFYTEFYESADIRFATKNFCYAVREKEEVHPFAKACDKFKRDDEVKI